MSLQSKQPLGGLFVLFLLSTSQLVPCHSSSHILLMPFSYRSHVAEISAIGKGLLERGHRVTMLLSESYPEIEIMRKKSGFNVIDYAVSDPDFYTKDYGDSSTDWMTTALFSDPVSELRTNVDGFIEFCTNPLADKSLPNRILHSSYGKPDLAIIDSFPNHRCLWILSRQLDIPYISLTTQYEPWLWRAPALPSFVPFPFAAGGLLTEKMTFWQRVENIWSLIDWTAWPQLEVIEDRFVQRYLPDETYSTLAARSLLWLFDTDVVVDYSRPTMPNEINIGGLSSQPASPLAAGPLKTFVDQSHKGLVVISFGSMDFVSGRFCKQLLGAFGQFPDLKYVWRFDGEVPEDCSDKQSWPKNILRQKWIPQNDLLGHNKTVLFISHCGANSQYESIYQGVPMVCLTIWADQMYNAERMQYRGYGLHHGRFINIQTDLLVDNIRQVAFNRTYSDNVKRASAIYKSRPMNARQTAVWWIEHVIQHGASHLHSHAVDMVWYEYLMLDVIAIFVLIPVAVIASSLTAVLCWLCGRRKYSDVIENTPTQKHVNKKQQ